MKISRAVQGFGVEKGQSPKMAGVQGRCKEKRRVKDGHV